MVYMVENGMSKGSMSCEEIAAKMYRKFKVEIPPWQSSGVVEKGFGLAAPVSFQYRYSFHLAPGNVAGYIF